MMLTKKNLIDKLDKSTGEERRRLAILIINNTKELKPFLNILLLPPPTSTRFSWLLGDISTLNNCFTPNILSYCFEHLEHLQIHDPHRVILKQCALAKDELPKQLEGTVLSKALAWLENPSSSISTKEYAILTLNGLIQKHPEIKGEFRAVLEGCLPAASNALDKKIKKTLSKL